MGHDYIDFEDRHVHLNDFHIWALRHFFLHCARTASPADLETDSRTLGELRDFFDAWTWYGPGVVVGTDLTDFTRSDSARIGVLRRLLARTSAYVDSFGEFIPLDYLVCNVNTPIAYFMTPQPTSVYRDAIAKIAAMLPDAASN